MRERRLKVEGTGSQEKREETPHLDSCRLARIRTRKGGRVVYLYSRRWV